MASLFGLDLGVDVGGFFSGFGGYFGWIFWVFIILVILGLISWWIYNIRVYYIKIKYFENIGGNRFVEAGDDKARVVRLGLVNGELLWAKGKKHYLPADGLRMGTNLYYFAKNGNDGYWYNITLGDLDTKSGQLDIEPTDRDMKHTAYAIRKNTEFRFNKANPWDTFMKYGIPAILLLILIIGGGWLINKVGVMSSSVAATTNENMKLNAEIAETNKVIVTKIDQIMAESGIRQVPGG